ncbi:ExeM/NucH family extracellular endonuclease [Pseudoduganella aquatica]|uniref:ExeM/NucH family extracellular endonuclease n=1 Tax=Pseudoduganella aquatica TaxID=2660641 RepID=A0A7X4KNL9_9BURK|nr:ExeM/NucH family extracellular endonuclease [Pseudoduganella aquatica]MYN08306.1 ExeM/NucH family extracellular endonuclease [Pseudoduganella aquatica]
MKPSAPAAPGRLTVLAALLASLSAPALADSAVVISQVYGAGGNGTGSGAALLKHDFIELYNRSSTAVSLNGWSVQYASATGNSWAVTPLTNVMLQPGQYYMVQEAAGAGGTATTVTADKVGTLAMAAGAGKVALSNTTTAFTVVNPSGAALVDLVGYGSTANFSEGNAPTGTLGNLTAALRKGNGCTDTDNNGADFEVLAPNPRNTSVILACGATVVKPIVATCPSTLSVAQGYSGSVPLSATDEDSIVTGARISAGALAGIGLDGFTAAGAVGGTANVSLSAASNLGVGSYPVTIEFSNDGNQFATCPVTVKVTGLATPTKTIPQIQGASTGDTPSPYANTVQTAEGVVTLKVSNGFFMQDPVGDNDVTSSDGIFVFTSTAPTVQVGQIARVTGLVYEYVPTGAKRSYTEFKDVSAVVPMGDGPAITPVNVELGDNLAQVEGMLVRFNRPLTVNQAEFLGDRGELTLANGRLEVPTNRYPARSPEALALAASNAAGMIVLDDGLFVTPPTIPYIGQDGTVRVGDTVTDLVGVIDFGAAGGSITTFKLQPVSPPVFSRTNPREDAPVLAPGNVKVASANVLNFFTTFTNGRNVEGQTTPGCKVGSTTTLSNCRGADNLAEFERQRDKIVAELKAIDADVYGLMEIQNNGDYAVTYLTNALNAAVGSPVYAVVPAPAATGTDAIRVAMIYKPSRLTLVGGALSDDDSVNNRPPMAQTFQANNGEKFSLVVNHLKSKGSCPSGTGLDADKGDSQSCWNNTRKLQAARLVNSFVPQVVAAAGDPDVLLIGDMNSYGMEDPVFVMTNAGFVNQLERFVRPQGMPYSYVFGSNSGYLDHALASASLSPQVAGAAEWHLNADEPTVIDYNTDGKPQDLYNALAYRASDHDPVVVSLNLQPKFVDLGASVKMTQISAIYNRMTQKYVGSVNVTNTSAAPLSGPFIVKLNALTAGVTLDNASGTQDGAPYVNVAGATLAPGATMNVQLIFTNPSRGVFGYSPKFYSGTF